MRDLRTYILRSTFVFVTAIFASQITAVPLFAAVNHVVISQIQVNGTSSNDDEFVELYNPTSSPIDLTGFRLSRKNSSGTEGNLVTNLSGTIPARGYFLIGSAAYAGTTAVDASYTNNSNNLVGNYAVLLYNADDSAVLDKVGFGSNADFEASAAANPTNGGSLQRKLDDTNGHGLDTDNNSTDFEVLATSTPRNTLVIVSTPTPSPTATPSVTPSPTASASATPSATPTVTPTNSPTATPTSTPSATPTITPTPSPTPTQTPSSTPTATPTASPTMTPTSSPSPTPTVSPTVSPTASPSMTPTATPTSTPVVSPTPTATPGSVIGVFDFPNMKLECRVKYITFNMGWFVASFPTFMCVRTI